MLDSSTPVRPPSVAGAFYPGRREELLRAVDACLPERGGEAALAVLVPHAGYVFSGRIAGATLARVALPRDVVLLCFNHRGRGAEFGVWPGGAWSTPLGECPVDPDLARRVKEAFGDAEYDEEGHRDEHSGEVQVPFLQRLRSDVRIVPVALSVGPDPASCRRLAAFGRALAGVEGDFLVVASTDLNHYEDHATTVEKDGAVIREIERLDPEGLVRVLLDRQVSMCGFAPTLAAIGYARAKGATGARTVMHATSGDVTGERDRVVGYVGMIVPCS